MSIINSIIKHRILINKNVFFFFKEPHLKAQSPSLMSVRLGGHFWSGKKLAEVAGECEVGSTSALQSVPHTRASKHDRKHLTFSMLSSKNRDGASDGRSNSRLPDTSSGGPGVPASALLFCLPGSEQSFVFVPLPAESQASFPC